MKFIIAIILFAIIIFPSSAFAVLQAPSGALEDIPLQPMPENVYPNLKENIQSSNNSEAAALAEEQTDQTSEPAKRRSGIFDFSQTPPVDTFKSIGGFASAVIITIVVIIGIAVGYWWWHKRTGNFDEED